MSIELIKDIKELEPVSKKYDGDLHFSSFIEVYYRVNKHAKMAYEPEKIKFLKDRRDALKRDDIAKYEEVVIAMAKREEDLLNRDMMAAMDYLGYLKKDYDAMYKAFMENPETQAALIQAQAKPFQTGSKKGPTMTVDRAKKIYIYSEEAKTEALTTLMKQGVNIMDANPDKETEQKMLLQQARLSDQMHAKWGVDEDEFCFAMIHYNLMADPELVQLTQDRMQKLGQGAKPSSSKSSKKGKKSVEETKGAQDDGDDWGDEEGEAEEFEKELAKRKKEVANKQKKLVKKMKTEIEGCGQVQIASKGIMAWDFFLKFLPAVAKARYLYFKDEKQMPIELRRAALMEQNDKVYEDIVRETRKRQDECDAHVIKEAMAAVQMAPEQFAVNLSHHNSDHSSEINKIQANTNFDGKQKPKIPKEKAKEMYMSQQHHHSLMSSALMKDGVDPSKAANNAQIKARMDLELTRLADIMWRTFNVEEEEYSYAFLYYGFPEDASIADEVQKMVKKLELGE